MKRIILSLCVLMVSCTLDRWQNPTGETGVQASESEVAEEEQTEADVSDVSDQSDQSDQSGTTDEGITGIYPSTGTALIDTTETATEAAADFDWARVLITEIVTDPQQDFSDSAEGDGIGFNSVVGTGTISTTDEYVEIFNGTPDVLDVSQWTLNMLDGSDESQLLSDESLTTFFDLGGSVASLGAGEFAVLGNPAGSLNNTITVELYNELNELVDSVDVDDANATGLEDEAFTRLPDGTWGLTVATPGDFE